MATSTGDTTQRPRLCRTLRVLRKEVDRLWPDRDRESDGWLGDAEHAARRSDHNPDRLGRVHALDIDVGGVDAYAIVRAACSHPSTAYVIYARQIWSASTDFSPRTYLGVNPHRTHMHVSVAHSWLGRRSKRSWLGIGRLP